MASDNEQKFYAEYLISDVDKVDQSKVVEDQDDYENGGVVIMDVEGNYYYQTSDKLIKVDKLVESTADDHKISAQAKIISCEKIKLENNSKQTNDLNETISKDETVEIYEYNENDQDPDDPLAMDDADYKSKGVVKNIKKSTADQDFSCIMCPFKTNKKYLLSKHLKTHSEERPFKCSVCERGFKTKGSLINHRNTHLGRKPHACKDCDKSFTTSGELVRHVRYRHTHIKPHKCTECEYRSVELSKLKRHMRCHTGERPYQCPHCTYASPDTFKLKRHLRTHTGEKPYECDICHARFTQLNSLKHHRLIHSVNEKPVFQCNLCPTTCGRKTDLRLHIKKLHNSDQPIPCKRCGRELPDRYSYKMHVKTHQGEKCYRCEFCPYASVSQRHLESHVLIHLDKKPFECEICLTSFRQKQLYTRHMKVYHSDNYQPPQQRKKDRKCPHCDKMFAFNGNLIRHMETHDPSSRLSEEKQTLKLSRMKRVGEDGTVIMLPENALTTLSNECMNEETEKPQIKDEFLNKAEYEVNYNNEDTINYVYEDFETDDYYEEAQDDEVVVEKQNTNNKKLLIEVKIEKTDAMNSQTQQNNLPKTKSEKNDVNEMSLEASDDQDFMVIEVLPDDDDDDDDDAIENEAQTLQDNSTKIVYLNDKVTPNNEPLPSDCFGFEFDDEDDEEAKGAIKLFEMIEQE